MNRTTRFSLIALLACGSACSESEDPCGVRDSQTGYAEHAPFDARARVRRVDCGFQSSVNDLSVGADGSVWLRRGEFEDRGEESFFAPPLKRLTHVGSDGALLRELELPDYVVRHVVHPSGELTVFGWEKQEDVAVIQVRRLRPDGSVVAERRFTQDLSTEQRLDFVAKADGSVTRTTVAEAERRAVVLLARADGEETVFLWALNGIRIGRLDATLATRWLSPVTPSVSLKVNTWEEMTAVGAPWVGWGLDVDALGRTHVATPLTGYQRRAYVEVFGREPTGAKERAFLLSSFSPTGEFLSARAVAAQTPQEIVGLVVRDGAFALGASERAAVGGRAETPDLYFASGRLDGPVRDDVVRTLDVDRDDEPTSFFACGQGRYCFAGHTAFEPQKTGSAWSEGKGFLLAVDARGEQQGVYFLAGPRDTRVAAASEGPEGSVVFAFITNEAPDLARVRNHLKNNETWVGRLDGP
ncbi:hypothetical protein NVS55_12445 [Myxococcus stipitatus]|uniref:hypothetical protein n=1 Tax=Myxococcus stipitatus TaxID=83455 RepID=UPI003144FAD7